MTAVGLTEEDGKIKFGGAGSLISEKYVLTAAHLNSKDVEVDVVRCGTVDLRNPTKAAEDFEIENFIVHPKYDRNAKKNDIALIELSKSVIFNKTYIRPACLHQEDFIGETMIAVR